MCQHVCRHHSCRTHVSMVENVTGIVRVTVRRFILGPIVKRVCVKKERVMETAVIANMDTLVSISFLEALCLA